MRRLMTLTVVLALGLLVVACSGEDSAGTTEAPAADADSGPDATITIAGFSYSGTESASVGDTVEVSNEDSVGHTWTAVDGAFDSGSIGAGETFDFTFDEAGEFDYFCSIHPEMTGTITVEG